MRRGKTVYLLCCALGLPGLAFLAGCADITEYNSEYEAGLTVLSPDDFSVVGTVTGLSNPRCMLVYPGYLFVISTDGVLYRVDTETLEITGEFTIGASSSAGYSKIEFSPREGNAYLIGAQGKIIEVSLPGCQIVDEFSVCPAPIDLAVTGGYPGYLWVADGSENSIHQVKLDNNDDYYTLNYPQEYAFRCMEASIYDDSLLVGTSILVSRVEALAPGSIRSGFMLDTMMGLSGLCRIPNDSNFVVVNSGGNQIGELCPYDRNTYPSPPPRFYNDDPIEGSLFHVVAANDNHHVFAFGYLNGGMSRLYRYSYIYPFGINDHTDVSGYPLDIEVSGTGLIYILTYR